MSRTNNHKLRVGIVGAGGIVRDTTSASAQAPFGSGDHRRFQCELRKRGKILSRKSARRRLRWRTGPTSSPFDDLDIIWIGTPPYMHSAVTDFRARSRQTRFLSGAHVDGSARKPRKCSRPRSDIRNWSRCFVRRRTVCAAIFSLRNYSRKTTSAARTTSACKVSTVIFSIRKRPHIGASALRSAG